MSSVVPERRTKTEDEVRNVAVDFTQELDSGELLAGTPTITESTGDLTISNKAVSTSSLTINGSTVATGGAVQFKVSGGTAGTTYTINIQCSTDSSPAQTVEADVELEVT